MSRGEIAFAGGANPSAIDIAGSDQVKMMGGVKMSSYRFLVPMCLGFCLLAVAGCAPQQTAGPSQAQLPPVNPAMARVWFFRQADPPGGNVFAADPTVSANDAPIAQIKHNGPAEISCRQARCPDECQGDHRHSRFSYRVTQPL